MNIGHSHLKWILGTVTSDEYRALSFQERECSNQRVPPAGVIKDEVVKDNGADNHLGRPRAGQVRDLSVHQSKPSIRKKFIVCPQKFSLQIRV